MPQNNEQAGMGFNPMNPMFAPQVPSQMTDAGNAMLNAMGMPNYQPRLNLFTSNAFAQAHPHAAGALQGALATIANMGETGPTVGDAISGVARGLMGGIGMQREFQYSQAMAPWMMAQQMVNFRKQFAPEPVNTPAGIVWKSPFGGPMGVTSLRDIAHGNVGMGAAPVMPGNPSAGAGQGQATGATNGGSFSSANQSEHDQFMSMLPDADPRERTQMESAYQLSQQMYDPQKAAEYLQSTMKDIMDKRIMHAQFEQNYQMMRQYRDGLLQTEQENAQTRKQQMLIQSGRFNLAKAQAANKEFDPAMAASERLAKMQDDVLHPNAQNDMDLLFNHIGMTMGAQRGSRMTEVEVNRAVQSRSLPQQVLADFQKIGLVPDQVYRILGQDPSQLPPGGFLSPNQRQQMLELGNRVHMLAWQSARSSAHAMGVGEYEPDELPGISAVPWQPVPMYGPGMGANVPPKKTAAPPAPRPGKSKQSANAPDYIFDENGLRSAGH